MQPEPVGPPSRRRDRRGRGARGPLVLPLAEGHRPPKPRTTRETFDRVLLDVVTELDARWSQHLGLLEYAVEDIPQLPADWDTSRVPLSSLVRGSGTTPTRLVVFRRPVEHRAGDRTDLEAIIRTVVVEQLAELLGLSPEDVDPRYADDED